MEIFKNHYMRIMEMKKIICLVLLAASASFMFQGCGKKSDPVAVIDTPPAPPTVTGVYPQSNNIDLPRNTLIYLTFSTDMKTTETQNALTISGMTGQKSWWNRVLIFKPDSLFKADDTVKITLTTGAQSTVGVTIAQTYTSSFVCGNASDITRPTILSTTPTNGQVDVSVQTNVSAVFSEKIAPWSASSLSLTQMPSTNVSGNVSLSNDSTINFIPANLLSYNTPYTASIDTAMVDLCGNHLLTPYTWAFQTVPDTVKPQVLSITPATGDTLVSVNQLIIIRFSEPMDTSMTRQAFSITPAATGSFSWKGDTIMTFALAETLAFRRQFQVTVGTGARDLAGNNLASPFSSGFTTVRGLFVCCNTSNEIYMFQQNDLKPEGYLPFYTNARQIRISADDSLAYILTQNGLEFVQLKNHNNNFATLNLPTTCYGLALSPNGSRLAVTDTLNKWLYIIDAATAQKIDSTQTGAAFPKGVCFNQGSSRIAVLCWGQVEIYNVSDLSAPTTVAIPNNGEEAVKGVIGDTLYVASGTGITAIKISEATELFRIIGISNHPFGLAISPDGAHLAIACYDAQVVRIYTSMGAALTSVTVGTWPKGLAYSPDGKYLYVSNSGSSTISVIRRSGNTYTFQENKTVGTGPWGIAVTP